MVITSWSSCRVLSTGSVVLLIEFRMVIQAKLEFPHLI